MSFQVSVELGGGCELLFNNRTSLQVTVPEGTNLGGLVSVIYHNHVEERPDQFAIPNMNGGTPDVVLRPGVLALVNDVDAEVYGGNEYLIEGGDKVSFISTLHGG